MNRTRHVARLCSLCTTRKLRKKDPTANFYKHGHLSPEAKKIFGIAKKEGV